MKIEYPNCAITCEQENCINRENNKEIEINCTNCRDKNKCLMAS